MSSTTCRARSTGSTSTGPASSRSTSPTPSAAPDRGWRGLVGRVRARGGEAVEMGIGNAPEWRDLRRRPDRLPRRRRKIQVVHAESSKAGGLCRLPAAPRPPGFRRWSTPRTAYYGLGGERSLKTGFFNAIEALLWRVGYTLAASPDERRFALETLASPPRRMVLVNIGLDAARFRPAPRRAPASTSARSSPAPGGGGPRPRSAATRTRRTTRRSTGRSAPCWPTAP